MTFSFIGSTVELITLVLGAVGLPGLFGLMAVENFGIPPIPSEVILPFAGFLVADGTFSFGAAFGVAVAGELVGAYAAYSVGRWGRSRLVGLGIGGLRLRETDLAKVEGWFAKHGEATVTLTRFVPLVRSYISYPAGTARMGPARFGFYTLLGTLPWDFGLLYLGTVLGKNWSVILAYVQPFDLLFGALLVLGIVYVVLLAAGRVSPGWPPRWIPRARGATTAPSSQDPPRAPPA